MDTDPVAWGFEAFEDENPEDRILYFKLLFLGKDKTAQEVQKSEFYQLAE